MAEINITPFTDVLLVLLIIFMILAALVTPPGFQKKLPDKIDNSPIQQGREERQHQVLSQRKGRDLHRQQADRPRRTSTPTWPTSNAAAGNKHVSLTADVKAPYGRHHRILDAARLAASTTSDS